MIDRIVAIRRAIDRRGAGLVGIGDIGVRHMLAVGHQHDQLHRIIVIPVKRAAIELGADRACGDEF